MKPSDSKRKRSCLRQWLFLFLKKTICIGLRNTVNMPRKESVDSYHVAFFVVVAVTLFMVLDAVTGQQRNFRTLTTAESGQFACDANQ